MAAAIVATLTSMVLALMLSSANSSFSTNAGIVKKLSSDFVHLDHMLRAYGREANDARAKLRAYATMKKEELFPSADARSTADRETADELDALLDAILLLPATDRRPTALSAQALTITTNIYAERWLLWENPGTTVPLQFLYVLIFWLFLIFVSFGVFAPVNLTVIVSFFPLLTRRDGSHSHDPRAGRSDAPTAGFRISSEPMRRALLEIDRP